jgi:hypothetical protein
MTDSDFLISLAGRRHYEPGDARRLVDIALDLRRLQSFADACVKDAIAEARTAEAQIRDRAAAELARVCREHKP